MKTIENRSSSSTRVCTSQGPQPPHDSLPHAPRCLRWQAFLPALRTMRDARRAPHPACLRYRIPHSIPLTTDPWLASFQPRWNTAAGSAGYHYHARGTILLCKLGQRWDIEQCACTESKGNEVSDRVTYKMRYMFAAHCLACTSRRSIGVSLHWSYLCRPPPASTEIELTYRSSVSSSSSSKK